MIIPDDTLMEVCKMGQGNNCCRYIVVDPDEGIVCAKGTALQPTLDANVSSMHAQGDNCDGLNGIPEEVA